MPQPKKRIRVKTSVKLVLTGSAGHQVEISSSLHARGGFLSKTLNWLPVSADARYLFATLRRPPSHGRQNDVGPKGGAAVAGALTALTGLEALFIE